jgi:hypothetical protein
MSDETPRALVFLDDLLEERAREVGAALKIDAERFEFLKPDDDVRVLQL